MISSRILFTKSLGYFLRRRCFLNNYADCVGEGRCVCISFMQEAIEVPVGKNHYVTQFSGSKRRKVPKRESFYYNYSTIAKTLKQLLGNPSVRSEILKDKIAKESLCDNIISDGSYISTHPFFISNPNRLQIIAYYDEVETCNVLGSSSKKFNKLGCFFLHLGIYSRC